jgi:hypothetical protein
MAAKKKALIPLLSSDRQKKAEWENIPIYDERKYKAEIDYIIDFAVRKKLAYEYTLSDRQKKAKWENIPIYDERYKVQQ